MLKEKGHITIFGDIFFNTYDEINIINYLLKIRLRSDNLWTRTPYN